MKTKLFAVLLFAMLVVTLPTSVIAKEYDANFINSTSMTVRVAVVFNDIEDDWVNIGWVHIPPRSSKIYTFDLKSANIYIYAQTEEYEWSGDEDDPHYPIADQKFYYSLKTHPGAEFYNVSFAPLMLSASETVEYEFEE